MTQRERRLGSVGEMTPERLAELRRVAEAANTVEQLPLEERQLPENVWRCVTYGREFTPPTVLAMLDEIERLRRERETLAAAVRAWDDYAKTIIENGPLAFDAIDAMERAEQRHREALALLEGGGGE